MDSPVMPQGLTLEQVGFYTMNGYLVVDGIVAEDQCDHLVRLAEQKADDQFRANMNLDRIIPEFRELMTRADLVGMLETLVGRKLVGLMSQFLYKKVGSDYAGQAWNPHQDNAYPLYPPGCYITTNISLADTDKENGGFIMYPGSHREGLFPAVPQVSFRERVGARPGNIVAPPKRFETLDLMTKKGSVLFLSGEVAHASYPNVSSHRDRPLFQGTYGPYGVPYWPGSPKTSDKKWFPLHPMDDYFDD